MPWKAKLGDHVFDLEDMELDKFDGAARADGRANPFGLVENPLLDARRGFLVLEACAATIPEEERPALPAAPERNTARELKRILEVFEYVDDEIGDRSYMNGNPPMPAEPESGFSSGASGDSAGLPTSSDVNEPATS